MQPISEHFVEVCKIVGIAVFTLLIAASVGGCGGTGCTDNFVPALNIRIFTSDGTNVTGARDLVLEYRIPGHDLYDGWRECRRWDGGEGWDEEIEGIESTSCGPDERGTYEVRATLGETFGTQTGIVVAIDDDRCHAVPTNVDIAIE